MAFLTQLADLQRATQLKAEQEVERLRLEYIAREERFVLDGDRQELARIKQDLDDLRRAGAAAPDAGPGDRESLVPPPPKSSSSGGIGGGSQLRGPESSAVRQLRQERQVGFYLLALSRSLSLSLSLSLSRLLLCASV